MLKLTDGMIDVLGRVCASGGPSSARWLADMYYPPEYAKKADETEITAVRSRLMRLLVRGLVACEVYPTCTVWWPTAAGLAALEEADDETTD